MEALFRLSKRPLQTLLAVVVLGAGLGSVVFCLMLVNGLVLRPLPFTTSDRLYAVGYAKEEEDGLGRIGADYLRLRPAIQGVEATAAFGVTNSYVRRGSEPVRVSTTVATYGLLDALGVRPIIGRGFTPSDDRPGAAPVALLAHLAWKRDYGGNDVVGTQIEVNGQTTTIVGILPPGFAFPYDSAMLLPARLADGEQRDLDMIVLARPGTSVEQLQGMVANAGGNVGKYLDGVRAGRRLAVKPISHLFVEESVRTYLTIMVFAGLLVLAVACANVANLQLMQTLGRQRDMAIRSALGAPRSEIIRDVLVECAFLSLGAAIVALVVANLAGDFIVRMFVDNGKPPPYFVHFGIDGRLLGMTAAVAVLATGLAGLPPALKASRLDLVSLLHDGDKGSSGGKSRSGAVMVSIGVAMTTILLSGAVALLLGLGGLARMDVGTSAPPDSILTGTLELHSSQFPDNASRSGLLLRVAERLRSDPNVATASVATTLPGAVLGSHERIGARGTERPAGGHPRAQMGAVGKDFLETFGISILDGRGLDRFVSEGQLDVALVDENAARLLWPERSPIGQTLLLNPDRDYVDAVTVVGLIAPLQLDSVLAPRLPTVLVPIERNPRNTAVLAVRTKGPTGRAEARIADAIRAESAYVTVNEVVSHATAIDRARLEAIVLTRTFLVLGIVALLLAMGGLFAVVSLSIAHRGRQIGIIRALGARERDVLSLIIGRTGVHVLVGLLVGAALAVPFSRLLADPGTSMATSLITVLVIVAIIALVGILSTLRPLRRALRIDPLTAIQQE